MSHGDLQGWSADPFQLHEQRYFSAGQPTKLVRNGGVESYDEPPSVTFDRGATAAAAVAGTDPARVPPGAWPREQLAPPIPSPGDQLVPPTPSAGEQAAAPAPAAASPRRRPRFGVIYTAAALALIAVAGVVVIVVRGGAGQTSVSDVAYVTHSAQHTAAQHSVDVSLAGTVQADGQTITISGAGGINFSTDSSELTLLMTVAGHRVIEKEIQVPGAAYVTLTVDGKNLARQIGGRDWIRVPVQSSSTATARGGSPQSALRLLEQRGIAVQGLGSKTIGGVQCAGYSVTPSRQAMLAAVRQVSAGKLPPGLAATLRAVTPPTFTIWLDSHGLLRQMTANLQVGAVPGSSAAAAANVVENFSGYGTPVQIVAPARSDVLNYQKFAQHAAAGSA
jgi:hypothetical protein